MDIIRIRQGVVTVTVGSFQPVTASLNILGEKFYGIKIL